MFDEMFDKPSATAVIEKPNAHAEATARRVCSETLKGLGYEVKDAANSGSGVDLIIAKGEMKYTLGLSFAGEESATHFRIPVGTIDTDQPSIFKMEADCIGFYQKAINTIYQFKLDGLRDLLLPVVTKLKADMKINFYAQNAIANKRLHVSYCAEDRSYFIYLYLPIEALCKQLKHTKQNISK